LEAHGFGIRYAESNPCNIIGSEYPRVISNADPNLDLKHCYLRYLLVPVPRIPVHFSLIVKIYVKLRIVVICSEISKCMTLLEQNLLNFFYCIRGWNFLSNKVLFRLRLFDPCLQ
jgi:hypothetical protein